MTFNLQRLQELFEKEQNIAAAARKYCEENQIEYTDSWRRKASKLLNNQNEAIGFTFESQTKDSETSQYSGTKSGVLSARKENGSIMTPKEFCETYGLEFNEVRSYKLITHLAEPTYNIASHVINEGFENLEQFKEDLLKSIQLIPTRPQTILRAQKDNSEEYLLVVDPCDVHLGKLASAFETGEDYNNQIAIKRVKEGVAGIINKASGFKIDKILFIAGNDILHIDTPKRTTTSGTPQDTDGMWYDNFLLAKQLYIDILSDLLDVADVHFVHNPSNHDWTVSWLLADVIKTYFKDCSNITFDCSINHRKYFRYHSNLIGSTHGDSAKTENLPALMAHEAKDWSSCKHRYIYTHHVHHKSSKDYVGVTVESMRSPSAADGWHARSGYVGVPQAIEGFIHSKEFGQVARLTHIF